RHPAPADFPAVTILKPLHGDEPGLRANLTSFFRQDYPGPLQIIFGVQSRTDPAIKIVQSLCDQYPAVNAALVISPRVHGDNAKISNLANMEASITGNIRHQMIVISDSDIAVAPDYLRALAAALAPADTGAVTCLYTGWAATPGIGARLSAMGISYHFLPNVVTGISLKMAKPCMGSTIALSSATLSDIGGIAAFADYLADDYEIGRAVRDRGLEVAVPGFAVRHGCTEASFKAYFTHELRWMRTIAINDIAGHVGSIVTHPVPLALISYAFFALLGGPFSLNALYLLGATLGARAMLKWRIDRCFGATSGPIWLLPLRDICAFCVFIVSLFGGPVDWQGEKLHVAAGGILSKADSPAKNRG
ncbi:MAG: bacteriohopanetetrol glucosamine biosynthesis glycosyltransferase HpnI, partial [Rhizomicrobium sp.]